MDIYEARGLAQRIVLADYADTWKRPKAFLHEAIAKIVLDAVRRADMKYVIHLEWESFVAQATATGVGDEPIYLQDYAATTLTQGIPHTLTSVILATYADAAGAVHAARLLVETLSLLAGNQRAYHQALRERTAQARQIVVGVLNTAFPDAVRPGLLLVPGLREDLNHFETDHDLWRWEDARDPLARRLVATAQEESHADRP